MHCLEEECIEKLKASGHGNELIDGQGVDDYCTICWSSSLGQEPSVRLACRHVFHVECILKILRNKWLSPRIVFQFLNCPQCKSIKIDAPHCPPIFKLTSEIGAFQEEVQKKALLRIKFEDLDKDPRLQDPNDDFYNNLQAWAMFKLAYYQCFKCKEAYFGG